MNRVMSIRQETVGSKRDFGMIGFSPEKNTSYLVFPKSLAKFKDARIVGINYDLIRGEGNVAGKSKVARRPTRTSNRSRKAKA